MNNHTTIWNILKNIPIEISSNNTCEYGLYHRDIIKLHIRKIEGKLNVDVSEHYDRDIYIRKNYSYDSLQKSAEMFLYAYSCPDSLKPWFYFYSNLFQKQSPNEILLTLNRMLKPNKNKKNKNLIAIARKLFERATTLFSLKHMEIRKLMPKSGTRSFGLNESDNNLSMSSLQQGDSVD